MKRIAVPLMLLLFLALFSSSTKTIGRVISGKMVEESGANRDVWSQYRGPNRDGVSQSTTPIKVWPAEGPKLLWKQPIGEGFSGIVIAGERIITAFEEDSTEFLGSFDRQTGEIAWRVAIGKMFVDDFGNGPRSTPALSGNQVFMLSSYGDLYAIDVESGEKKWTAAITDNFGVKVPRRGFTTSPLVHETQVVLNAGGGDGDAFVGLDKNSGHMVWQAGDGGPNNSSPIVANIDGVQQHIFCSTRRIEKDGKPESIAEVFAVGADGKILWRGPSLPGVVGMPLFIAPDKVFISSSTDQGCLTLQVSQDGDTRYSVAEVWKNREMKNHFNSSVYYEGHIYGFSKATLKCIDAETGERKWRKRGFGKGSLIVVDGKLLVVSDRGRLAMVEATGDQYRELAVAQVLDGKSWTSPTFADGKLYLRNLTEMACYDLGGTLDTGLDE